LATTTFKNSQNKNLKH